MKFVHLLCIISFAFPGARGWGASGHHAVGYIAMQFLTSGAVNFVQSSLGAEYSYSLGPAATWADTVRSRPEYQWSAPLHYIDAEDNPPHICSVKQTRDCSDGMCILTAIANYTSRVVDKSLDDTQRQEALKFLDHFLGDITQPLHNEALALGGTQIDVVCNGTRTNLHAVWDTNMINIRLADYGHSVTAWADALAARIRSSPMAQRREWIQCSSTSKPVTNQRDVADDLAESHVKPLKCPLEWSRDANEFDCTFVFNYTPATDLCTTSYYDNVIPIIETQIMKGGYRLAAWLNVLFDGKTGLSH